MTKVLVDVSHVDTAVDLFGYRSSLPIVTAPTGGVGFGWRGGDACIARAAAAAGIPYTLSSSATSSIERTAAEAPGHHWLQCYILNRREFTFRMIDRARTAGYSALMITVDLPVGGKRERDYRNDFTIPFRYTSRNVLDFASKPLWALDMLFRGVPGLEILADLEAFEAAAPTTSVQKSSIGRFYSPSFDWNALKGIRDVWSGPLIVKGIVVSNHGGRQLDDGIATLDALPAVAAAAGDSVTVMIDGGVRRGRDVVKALALGANAVMVGRATRAGGEAGAARAIDILREELIRTMQLCGVTRLADIGSELVTCAP